MFFALKFPLNNSKHITTVLNLYCLQASKLEARLGFVMWHALKYGKAAVVKLLIDQYNFDIQKFVKGNLWNIYVQVSQKSEKVMSVGFFLKGNYKGNTLCSHIKEL